MISCIYKQTQKASSVRRRSCSQELPIMMAPTRLQNSRYSSPLIIFAPPSSFITVRNVPIRPAYLRDRWDATLVKRRSKGCETTVPMMAPAKKMWYLRIWSCFIHSLLCSISELTIHMQEQREVRSLSIEKAAATGNTFFVMSIFIASLPICVLILLISTNVLNSPSATTPNRKFCCPRVRKHMLPMIMDRYPLKKPRYKVRLMTWLASNLATSCTRLRAILRTLMQSRGQASRWKADDSSPVAITLCRMVGFFSTQGMGARRWVSWYLRRMCDFYTILIQAWSSSIIQNNYKHFLEQERICTAKLRSI